jgi:hypothetical protein
MIYANFVANEKHEGNNLKLKKHYIANLVEKDHLETTRLL